MRERLDVVQTNYKTKIFEGTFAKDKDGELIDSADIKFNKWIADHKDIKIIDFKYRHSSYGNQSICILYQEL